MFRFLLNPEVRQVWGSANEGDLLAAYEKVWGRKRILFDFYETWYRMIYEELTPGSILEIGAGSGNFRNWLRTQGRACWTLDILAGKHVDIQADALELPFPAGRLHNIVLIDTLHHLARPFAFCRQASALLAPGGRIFLLEPYLSPWSVLIYRYLHHEQVDFHFKESESPKKAWDGNAAIPRLVLSQVNKELHPLSIGKLTYCEVLSYALSGGFYYRSLFPRRWIQGLRRLEKSRIFQNRIFSLRVFAVLENRS